MDEREVQIRQSIVNNIGALVEKIETARSKKNRKVGQKDVEAIKKIGRDIATGAL
jgi:hypothetical protein